MTSDAVLIRETVAELDRFDVVLALASGPMPYVEQWRDAMSDRIRVSPLFPCPEGRLGNGGGLQCFASGSPWPDVEWLRRELASGRIRVVGELLYSYFGITPTDERMEPYFALAEEFDVPVAVHTGEGPPAEHRRGCCPDYRGDYGNPALLETVLERHPKLRLYLMHAGYPYLEETIALMRRHPGVYTDFSMLGVVRALSCSAGTPRTAQLLKHSRGSMPGSIRFPTWDGKQPAVLSGRGGFLVLA